MHYGKQRAPVQVANPRPEIRSAAETGHADRRLFHTRDAHRPKDQHKRHRSNHFTLTPTSASTTTSRPPPPPPPPPASIESFTPSPPSIYYFQPDDVTPPPSKHTQATPTYRPQKPKYQNTEAYDSYGAPSGSTISSSQQQQEVTDNIALPSGFGTPTYIRYSTESNPPPALPTSSVIPSSSSPSSQSYLKPQNSFHPAGSYDAAASRPKSIYREETTNFHSGNTVHLPKVKKMQ